MTGIVLALLLMYFLGIFVYSVSRIVVSKTVTPGTAIWSFILSVLVYGSMMGGVIYLAIH